MRSAIQSGMLLLLGRMLLELLLTDWEWIPEAMKSENLYRSTHTISVASASFRMLIDLLAVQLVIRSDRPSVICLRDTLANFLYLMM